MARIRITLEGDDGRAINGDKERLYDLSGGTMRFVDIEAAVEALKQAAWSVIEGDELYPNRGSLAAALALHQCGRCVPEVFQP